MKTCNKCKEQKASTEFNMDRAAKDGLQGRCRSCSKSQYKEWYSKNSHKVLARMKTDEVYKAKARSRANAKHQELKNNPDYQKENIRRQRAWAVANPEKARKLRRAYKYRKQNAVQGIIPDEGYIYEFYGNACLFPDCDKPITDTNPLTLDHVIPITLGGPHVVENLQPLCRSHNSSKNNRSVDDYRGGRILLAVFT